MNRVTQFLPLKSKIRTINFLILVVFLSFFSCQFQLSEIPETFVEQAGEAPTILIEVSPQMDTLRLASNALAQFSFSSEEELPEWIRIYFDEELIIDQEYHSYDKPQFNIQPNNYSNGYHQFTIQAIIGTHTGSIAEKLGAENFLYEANWPVFIQNGANANISGAKFENGQTTINWNKYNFYDFFSYQFSKESNLDGNEFTHVYYNPATTSFVDKTYLEGEIANYCVVLNGTYRNCYSFQVPIAEPEVSMNENNEIRIEWQKSKNMWNWGSYFITSKYELNGFVESQRIYHADSTSTLFKKIGFGKPYEFQVRFIPKTFNGEYLNFTSAGGVRQFSIGKQMPTFSSAFFMENTHSMVIYKRVNYKDRFYKYNTQNWVLEDSVQIDNYLVSGGEIMHSPNGAYFAYFTNEKFELRKTSDFSLVKQLNFPFLNFGNLSIYGASLSNDLRLFVVDIYRTFKVYDINSGEEIFRKTKVGGDLLYKAILNADATRILFENSELGKSSFSLYRFENNTLTHLSALNDDELFSDKKYYFVDNKILIYCKTNYFQYKTEIRSSENLALEQSYQLPYEYEPLVVNPDESKMILHYVHSGDNGYSYLTDIENKVSTKIFPVLGWGPYILSEGQLYSGSGKYISSDELIIHE